MTADARAGITPGPWRWGNWKTPFDEIESGEMRWLEHCPELGNEPGIRRREHCTILIMMADDVPCEEDRRAIAEVPALIEALDWLLDALDAHVPDKSPTMLTYYEQAKATYKRATGHDHSSSGQDQLRRIT